MLVWKGGGLQDRAMADAVVVEPWARGEWVVLKEARV